jgi:DNA polymerase (family 10)
MTNRDIAAVFDEIAELLEFQGANPFRVRAYRNVARLVGDLPIALAEIVDQEPRSLKELKGVGDDLADKIYTLVTTGSLPFWEELKAAIPAGLVALMRVPGLGPKKAAALHRELGVQSLADLRAACEAHRVRELKGFGAKTEATILKGLALAEQAEVRMRWADADAVVDELRPFLAAAPGVRRLEFAGSYRRGRETVGDLDVLVDSDDAAAAMDRLASYAPDLEVLARGDTKMSVRLASRLQIDLRVVPAESFGAALQYFTGSKDHNVTLRGRARQAGLKINEWGVYRLASANAADQDDEGDEGAYVAGRTEEDVYAALGLPWIPPELREARQEFAWADAGRLPELVRVQDIRGDLHMHTTETDGKATLAEMAAAARQRGLEYIAITDHSQRVTMARGLDPTRLRSQWKAIDRLNAELSDLRMLKGIECDILEAGGMDLPDDVLAEADWVIASVHYGQTQSRAQITERILGALEHPYVHIVAHPTGRLINRREPYEVDLSAVMEAAARHGKFLELNANPARLDLDDVQCAAAKRLGIPIVISTDAHHVDGLDLMRHGVQQARRGGLTAADVLNCLPWSEFEKRIRK